MARWVVLAVGVFALVLANYTIYSRERLLADGAVVMLRLAPVDPRSLMQGDYMALRFAVADEIRSRGKSADGGDGRVVLSVDDHGVGSFSRLDTGTPPAPHEVMMRYRIRAGRVKFATNAYFFQEGDGHLYTTARYGAFRVDAAGRSILTGLYDGDLNLLGSGRPGATDNPET